MSVVPLKTTHLQQDDLTKQKAVELRKLRKKIFKLTNQQKQQIDQIRRSSVLKHIPINQKAQKIIEGNKHIQQNSAPECKLKKGMDIQNSNQKRGGLQNETKENENEGIYNYWKKVLVSQYEQSIKPHDLEYLEYLKSISVKEYSIQKTSLVFSFRPGHKLIDQGIYEKTIRRNQQGEPVQYTGQMIPNAFKMKKGFCKIIFAQTHDIQHLQVINFTFQNLCEQLIPRSLQYYLDVRSREINRQIPDEKVEQNANKITTYLKIIID